MKKLAYVLLIGGFLYGAYVAALDETVIDWPLFAVAAFAAIAGVILAKRADSAAATSGEVLEMNRNELNESIANIVRDLGEQCFFGAGLVVLGEAGDLLEEVGAGIVVEVLRRDRLLRPPEPFESVGGELGDSGRQSEGRWDGHTSLASRIPLNCHRTSGGKKLR